MMSKFFDGVANFFVDTVVLLVSGCVSLVVLSGGVAVLAVLGARQLKCISSKKIAEENKRKADESFGRTETLIGSDTKCSLNCDSTGGDRAKWFVTSAEKNIETLKHLKQLPTTVASSSSSEKDAEVREFLEHLIGTLISENLDDVPLTPLSNDVQYETIFAEYHSKLSSVLSALSSALHSTSNSESTNETDKPSNLYVRLKMIINEISEKASLLPSLLEYDNDGEPLSIESRLEGQSYEDILATAVLNKIISKCQNGKEPYSFSDEVDLNITSDFEYRCNNNTSSWNSSPQERLSLTVEEHIEEITTRYTSSDDDENEPIVGCLQSFNLNTIHRAQFPELGKDVVDGYNSYDEDSVTEIVSNVDSWEDNWLFQKKKKNKIKTTVAQVSVPMLVPNPSEKYRALIGDVDVDETSDLSECSDSILEELTDFTTEKDDSTFKTSYIYKYDFKNNLDPSSLKGKHFDDSENCSADHDQDSSGVTSISRDISDVYSFSSLSPCQSEDDSLPWTGISEAKNQSIFLGQEDSGEGSLDTQPEHEYLNTDDLERHISQNKVENEKFAARKIDSENHKEKNVSKISKKNENSSLTEDLAQPPRPGTIAEREHAKWERAAPLSNNPYSKESIERRNIDNLYARCSSTNSSLSDQNNEAVNDECSLQDTVLRADIKKYERDYYVNLMPANGTSETKSENGVSNVKPNDENLSQNSLPKIVSSYEERPNKKTNLVRVSSWSDRKQPGIEIKKRLPSVKELAKQFSVQPNFHEVKKPCSNKNQMVHSLTARSMSREFREGLKNNVGKTFNRNVLTSSDGNDKCEEELNENGDSDLKNKLNNTISFWENI